MFDVGQKMIRKANINVITRDDFDEAAQMAVRCSRIIDLADLGDLEAALKMKMDCECDPMTTNNEKKYPPSLPGNLGSSGFESSGAMSKKGSTTTSNTLASGSHAHNVINAKPSKAPVPTASTQNLKKSTEKVPPTSSTVSSPSSPFSPKKPGDDKKSSQPSSSNPPPKSASDVKKPEADKKTSSTSKDDKSSQDSNKKSTKNDPFSNGDTVIV
jgi:hypothetical protein